MRHPVLDERTRSEDDAPQPAPAAADDSLPAADLLLAMLEGTDDGLVLLAPDGRVLHLNAAARRAIGLGRAAIVGRHVRDLPCDRFDWNVARDLVERRTAVAGLQRLGDRTLLVSGRPVGGGRLVLTLRDVSETSRLMARFQRTAEQSRQSHRELAAGESPLPPLVAASALMRAARDTAVRYAGVDLPVCLLGETGTGKNLFAELIHRASGRRRGPFLEVNCGAIPEGLIEAELFGYARGAFTGADARGKVGLVELAERGTLLLDEIGDLPLALQVKLLRFLEAGEIRPLGAVRCRRPDVRIIAATNADLRRKIAAGTFRADLFYRLNVLTIDLPPLREHADDIPWLVRMMLGRLRERVRRPLDLTPAALERLSRYQFPGNVRELCNVLERAGVTAREDTIDVADLPPEVVAATGSPADRRSPGRLREAVRHVEASLLRDALERWGTQEQAARHLGVGQATVARKARRYGLR